MPNKLMQWNEINGMGNPRKVIEINKLMKGLKKMEVQKLDVVPKAWMPLKEDNFQKIVKILKKSEQGPTWKYGVLAQMCFQVHIIARIDDSMNFLLENIEICLQVSFCLKMRLKCSKNVREERDAPQQIILGSCDF